MRQRVLTALPVVIGLAMFLGALEILRLELRPVGWHQIAGAVADVPVMRLGAALVLTALNYLALTGYDLLAFKYVGKAMPTRRIAGTAILAYAIANNVGFAMFSGASVRYRFYTRWGVTPDELSRIIFSYSVTFWLGLCAIGGISLVMSPMPSVPQLPAQHLVTLAGWLLLLAVAAFLVATVVRRTPLRVFRFTLPLPHPLLAGQQLLVSAVDWALAGAVLFVLLPPGQIPFLTFLGSFVVSILLGMLSHVPGGVGVFEGLMVLLVAPYVPSVQLLPALVVYRAVYYLLPFAVALVALVLDEAYQRRHHLARASAWVGALTEQVTPRLLAAASFFSGSVLLWSGATPATPGRLDLLNRVLPLGVVEASHFIGSVAGAGLLVLSQGVARRLDAAYYLSALLIVVGMVTSLLKGFDYEEALLLLLVLLALTRARPAFDRRAAFFDTRFSAPWLSALAGAFAATLWLGMFAFKHVDYANELWWQFELHGDASRFLRASVGAAVAVMLFATARLLRPAPHEFVAPTPDDLDAASRVIEGQSSTSPNLVFLGDKSLLFNEARTGFVMYGVQGRTWVAMGDPVGSDELVTDLIIAFLERCDDFGGVPVFYEVGPAHLHRYADVGLTFVKLGEDAKVNLATITTDGGPGSKYRQIVRHLVKDGGVFRVVPQGEADAVMPQLRAVSDQWLQLKAGGEKGFSLGFFDEAYLRRFSIAVIEREGQIVAFANLWQGPQRRELSIDLMRYSTAAPKGVMEALLVHVMLWGKAEGYQRFALGMAPLSGVEASPLGSSWNRVGSFLYEHGEGVYGFQGLRAFKDKFNPTWEPRYLAYPGGLRLPMVLADTSALIAGGYRRILLKGG
jgi:phosphatidylglycerol lysyltransferase